MIIVPRFDDVTGHTYVAWCAGSEGAEVEEGIEEGTMR